MIFNILSLIFNLIGIILRFLGSPIHLFILIPIKLFYYVFIYVFAYVIIGKEEDSIDWNYFVNEINQKVLINEKYSDNNPFQTYIRLSKNYLNQIF